MDALREAALPLCAWCASTAPPCLRRHEDVPFIFTLPDTLSSIVSSPRRGMQAIKSFVVEVRAWYRSMKGAHGERGRQRIQRDAVFFNSPARCCLQRKALARLNSSGKLEQLKKCNLRMQVCRRRSRCSSSAAALLASLHPA